MHNTSVHRANRDRKRGPMYMSTMPPQRFFGDNPLAKQTRHLSTRYPLPMIDHRLKTKITEAASF